MAMSDHEQTIYCGTCGQRNPLGNIFCGRCGRPLHPGPDFPHVAGVPSAHQAAYRPGATNRQRGAQLMAIGCLVMVGAVVGLAVLLLLVGVL